MNSFLFILVLFVLCPKHTFANVGFLCPKTDQTIERVPVMRGDAPGVTLSVNTDGADPSQYTSEINEAIFLPPSDAHGDFQDRIAFYYGLMGDADAYFPMMPGALQVFHITRSTKLYRNGFQALESKGEAVTLPKMYCSALIKAILGYGKNDKN